MDDEKNRVHSERQVGTSSSPLLFPGSVLKSREVENKSSNQTLLKARAQEKQSYVSLKRVDISFLTV